MGSVLVQEVAQVHVMVGRPGLSCWVAHKGKYGAQLDPSTAVLPLDGSLVLERDFQWNRL
jgi:hypothetical protein